MPDEQLSPQETPAPEPEPAPARRPRRRHPVVRVFALLLAIVAALLAASLTIDLGPSLKSVAEKEGSKFIQRPMRIGKLKVVLLTGTFVVEDLLIEGLAPSDRPFLRAKRIAVNLPWWSAFSHALIIDNIDMTDWDMLVEVFPNGRHNFPKFTRDSRNDHNGPKTFRTTLRYMIARRGQFTLEDHSARWGVISRNLNVTVFRSVSDYRGTAQFSNGTINIQDYPPFRADMNSRFKIDNGKVLFDRIDLPSAGSKSVADGYVDLRHWPEQLWNVRSRVDFQTEKAIFFKDQNFTVTGYGDFTGTFHLFKGGRELKGVFTSPEAGVNSWRFPGVKGSLLWIPTKFEVTDVTTGLYGGRVRFNYAMGPFGQVRKARAVWDANYQDVDLSQLTDFLQLRGIRLAGRASGANHLEWPLGKWAEKRGSGQLTADPPAGVRVMTRQLPTGLAEKDPLPPEQGPFNPHAPMGYVSVAGQIAYSLDPDWITIANGWAATQKTHVQFEGSTGWGRRSRIPFHVTSADWQESDRLLVGIMNALGSNAGAVPVSGRGEFEGVMLEGFSRPRIEGRFAGERMRAWDVVWGRGRADLVIDNSYVTIANGLIEQGTSQITADGKFSLGFPRDDGGEEINARVRIVKRPVADLRHAFDLDTYPVEGLASGDYRLYGKYQHPFGFGTLVIDEGKAYGESFDTATANLRFEGNGVRLEGTNIRKSTGAVTGAAWVAWDGSYSFNADGSKIPVESLASLSLPRLPLSGLLQFTAAGTGTFGSPRYDVKTRIDDLFAGDEGIGQIRGQLSLRNETLTLEMEAASPRLAVTGSGRIALTPEMDSELTFHVSDTSLDPYIRFFQPKLSPFTTAVADGTIRVSGELSSLDHLVIEGHVDQLKLKLLDYSLHNEGPLQLTLNRQVLQVQRLRLAGEGTALEVGGEIAFHDKRIALEASGDTNLGILQGLFRDVRSSGNASLHAEVRGPLDTPVLSGNAAISNGRLRVAALPHSLQSINGHLSFDAQGIRLDDVTAELGGGQVHFGGRVGLNGYALGTLNLTAAGDQMHIRYPEGFRSVIDAELALRGDVSSPLLSGTVTVHDALYNKRFEPNADIFGLAGGASLLPAPAPSTATLPLRFDVRVLAPSTLRIENNLARVVSSADLTLSGTYDRPLLTGRADIERGEILFEGNRYVVTRGTFDFFNPSRIDPFFDIEAETRVRLPSETYRVTLAVTGTLAGRVNLELNSDPPLPTVDILSLLFNPSQTDLNNAELHALSPQAVTQSQEQLLRAGLARVFAAPIAAPVGRAVEQTLGIDTVQITPSIGTQTDPLTPTARLIIGKRLSNRAYLTFARALGTSGTSTRDQVIVLEYDQNDRVGWVLTQNGDRSFAVDFRVRRSF